MKKLSIQVLFASLFVFLCRATVQEAWLEVPFVPTPYRVVAEMLRMADVGKDDVLYDLGCGDGRIVITAAQKFGTRGVGIDLDPYRIEESRENAKKADLTDKVRFLHMDLFQADISEATVVTIYLLPRVNIKLRPKLLRELKPGTRIVSHNYDMGEWTPDQTSEVIRIVQIHTVYYWVVPANVTGTWEWAMPASSGKESYVLELNQRFQKINGIVTAGNSKVTIKDAEISGDKLQFTVERNVEGRIVPMIFEGRVSGNFIKGSVKFEAGPAASKRVWEAKRNPFTITPLYKEKSI